MEFIIAKVRRGQLHTISQAVVMLTPQRTWSPFYVYRLRLNRGRQRLQRLVTTTTTDPVIMVGIVQNEVFSNVSGLIYCRANQIVGE